MSRVVSVIMAGGKGERFWPFSRRNQPKQMLPLTTDKPLLVETVNRALPITSLDNVFIVSNEQLSPSVLAALPDLPPRNSLAEPIGRDTAPCLAFAAQVIRHRFGADTIMLVLSADHHVEHQEKFRDYLRQAICVAEAGLLCTIGLEPDRPETGYGYLQLGEHKSELGPDVYRVARFTEKPDDQSARTMLSSGNYLWNGGMFAWNVQVFLDTLQQFLPEVAEPFQTLAPVVDTPAMKDTLKSIFDTVPKISVDYGLMERASDVMTVAARGIGWDDLGSWLAFERLNASDQSGNTVKGESLLLDTENSIVASRDGLVVTIGVKDILVARSGNAVLVAKKDCAKQLRDVIKMLESSEDLKQYL